MNLHADYLTTPYQIMLYRAECELERAEDTGVLYFQVLSQIVKKDPEEIRRRASRMTPVI